MFNNIFGGSGSSGRRIFDLIQITEMGENELARRWPEGGGAGDIRIGSRLIVREGQAAVFFRDGKALDSFGPGGHVLTTANIPLLIDLVGKAFNDQTPFPAEVVFVNVREFPQMQWGTPQPILVRNPNMGLGVALLTGFGTYAFEISNAQQFVVKIMGTRAGLAVRDVQDRFRTMLLSKLQDLLAELSTKGGKSVPELIALNEEIGAGVLAKAQEDFKAMGVTLKSFYGTLKPSEKSAEELRAMGMLDMATYTQLQAADAMRDAAKNPSGGAGLTAGIGAGLGIGQIMGAALQGGMMNPGMGMQQPQQPQQAVAAGAAAGAAAAPAVPDIMSPAQAAQYLQVAENDIMTMINEGQIKAKKIGSQFRISKSALDEFLAS